MLIIYSLEYGLRSHTIATRACWCTISESYESWLPDTWTKCIVLMYCIVYCIYFNIIFCSVCFGRIPTRQVDIVTPGWYLHVKWISARLHVNICTPGIRSYIFSLARLINLFPKKYWKDACSIFKFIFKLIGRRTARTVTVTSWRPPDLDVKL